MLTPGRTTPAAAAATVALALLAARPASAQLDPHTVQPERPTVSTPASTVAPGWVEVEGGVEVDSYSDHQHGDVGPLAVKIGLARRWQLTVQESIVRAPGAQVTGLGDVALAAKGRLIEGGHALGDVAILSTVKFPTGSVANGDGTGTADVSLTIISSHAIGPVAVDVNYGVTVRSGRGEVAPRHASMWAAAASGPLHGRLGWTSEFFGFPATSGPAGNPPIVGAIEAATFQVRRWIAIDAGIALPIRGPQPHAVFAGLVCNLGRLPRAVAP